VTAATGCDFGGGSTVVVEVGLHASLLEHEAAGSGTGDDDFTGGGSGFKIMLGRPLSSGSGSIGGG